MYYTATIAAANVIIILVNTLCAGELWQTALFSVLGTVSVIAFDGITAFLIRRLPEKWFAPEKNAFKVFRFEKRLYSKLKVKRLASVVPELGGFTNFHKDKLESATDGDYLSRFLLESNYGVAIHIVNAAGGFVIGFLPFCGGVGIWLPVALVNFVLSMLPVFILRNNTPSLLFLYKRAQKQK